MSEDAMLKSWQWHQARLYTTENPQMVAPMFAHGWNARQCEIDDARAELAGARALAEYWRELAQRRSGL